ncbi:SDR family NAD(P)-dependent oxidoreductase [Henriciella sp. AS95]|uniref:SDR family NAD(P)-dependent oxidoreductase n=1 Tax=Henriciella sp. AS95 TaxID=3135782 RepID=UPI00316CC494
MTDQSRKLFLIGPGYSASRLAALCLEAGEWEVYGTARSADKAAALEEDGLKSVLVGDKGAIEFAARGAHWVVSTPPSDDGCPGFGLAGEFAQSAASITYLSTTGVYGDLQGGWAFEWLPVSPGSKRGERRVLAESQWFGARPDVRLVRLPGIYGPGRSQLDKVRSGDAEQIIKQGQVFSRIHVDDLAGGLKALIDRPGLSGAFNLCDDEPAPPQDVMVFAADLLGAAMPAFVDMESADVSDMAKSFYSECKRVPNAKLKAATGWRPAYPTYREGLQAVLDAEKS